MAQDMEKPDLEQAVADHYGGGGLGAAILDALARTGVDIDALTPADLAPVDELHIGGRAATRDLLAMMTLTPGLRALDVGCGIGGAARCLAAERGVRVAGIDLTPGFIDAAKMLAARTGLGERTDFKVASALDMPFADGEFEAAITIHAAMNIIDRPALYGEIARVLRPGAEFAIYDVMKGPEPGCDYPVPWAETAATSRLVTPEEMRALLDAAGFDIRAEQDRATQAIAFFEAGRAAAAARADGPPPLSLHLVTGADMSEKFANLLGNIRAGRVAPRMMLAVKRG